MDQGKRLDRVEQVALKSTHPMYCGMITGKKIIHTAGAAPFEFVPGESLVVPALETIYIDFPESDLEPTKCITLEIDRDKVKNIVDRLDEEKPRTPELGPWAYSDLSHLHFPNTDAIENVLESVVTLFTEDVPGGDVLIDLNASQLIVRMLQTESRMLLMNHYEKHAPSNGLAAAVHFARKHLSKQVTVSDRAEQAFMSESSFYRYFKNEFEMTPLQFLNQERTKRAQQMLKDRFRSVSEVRHEVGFSSVSYFINTFKQHVGQTPKQDQLAQCES